MVIMSDFYDIRNEVELILNRLHFDLRIFNDKKILITGGTGFFGLWMLNTLSKINNKIGNKMQIYAISRDPSNFLKKNEQYSLESNINFLKGDIQNYDFSGLKPNFLIHMATTNASETFNEIDQLKKIELLHNGTKNILNSCTKDLTNVLFTSSGIAYGNNKSDFILENSNLSVNTLSTGSSLSIGKIYAEYLVNYFHQKLGYKFSIARCFSFAGEYLPTDLHYAFGNFIGQALNNEKITLNSSGEDIRSYLYIGDAIVWLLTLLTKPKNKIYNVGSNKSISILELAKKINKIKYNNDRDFVMIDKDAFEGNFKKSRYVPSIDKIFLDYPELKQWTHIDAIIKKCLKT